MAHLNLYISLNDNLVAVVHVPSEGYANSFADGYIAGYEAHLERTHEALGVLPSTVPLRWDYKVRPKLGDP